MIIIIMIINNNNINYKFITYIAQITHDQMRMTYKSILTKKNYMIKIYKISIALNKKVI